MTQILKRRNLSLVSDWLGSGEFSHGDLAIQTGFVKIKSAQVEGHGHNSPLQHSNHSRSSARGYPRLSATEVRGGRCGFRPTHIQRPVRPIKAARDRLEDAGHFGEELLPVYLMLDHTGAGYEAEVVLGEGDYGVYYGGAALGHPTPNIDRIAKEGAISQAGTARQAVRRVVPRS